MTPRCCAPSQVIIAFLIVFMVFARSSPRKGGSPVAVVNADAEDDDPSRVRFAVVLDAGSTGSRVHVFKFKQHPTEGLKLISDTFEQLKPGLSSFPDDPAGAVDSLKPLLEIAIKTVPKDLQVRLHACRDVCNDL
jgi:Golgi nucleoside diphosphatase